MTDLILSGGGVEKSQDEKARHAVQVFRRMQPTLSSYARMITGNPAVRVEMSTSNGMTDGKKIYFRPPLALGDDTPHNRQLCDKRDATGTMRCRACAIREQVLIVIYHEIGHIAAGSFEEAPEEAAKYLWEALTDAKIARSRAMKEKLVKVDGSVLMNYKQLASYVSPWLPIVVNALEDARVNLDVMSARKGTRVMFKADTTRVLSEGVEQPDLENGGVKVVYWHEYPLNMQAAAGLYVKSLGYEYGPFFLEEVVTALNDKEVTRIISKVTSADDAKEIFEISLLALKRMQELGFFDPPEEEEEGDDGDSGEESSASGETDEESSEKGDSGEPGDSEEDSGDRSKDNDSDGSSDSDKNESESEDSDGNEDSSGDEHDEEGSRTGSDSGDSDPEEGESSGESSDGDGMGASEADSGESGDSADGEMDEDGSIRNGESSGGPSSDDAEDSVDAKPIDSGAADPNGGIEVRGERPSYGDDPDEAEGRLREVACPEHRPSWIEANDLESGSAEESMDTAIIQGLYFEEPSANIRGVREHFYGHPDNSKGWPAVDSRYRGWGIEAGVEGAFMAPESILGPALLRMRVAFADNQRGHELRHRKAGRIDASVLGKRAHFDDPRLFKTRILPGKKDYFVLIGVDISGSTVGLNIILAKRAAMAQAELCSRMGIKFAVYAHTGESAGDSWYGDLNLEIYHIKDADEPWDSNTRRRLEELGPVSANLDGHTMEFYRKILDTRPESHKVLLYYTDGKMPAENHDEELEILQREIKICRRKKYTLVGVGIRTDEPIKHGLDTVQVNDDADLVRVVKHLERRLLEI